jgi:U3 small nucleolar RNA-associated protein 5
MVSKKTAGRAVSKVSSAAAPATSSSTQVANKSAILQSAFSPSSYQLSLFASVIQGLESDLLRIHDTVTGRLKCEHAIGSRARITCLQWGRHVPSGKGTQQNHIQKKRKLLNGTNGLSDFSDVVVALGTNQSEVHLFSPEQSRVVGLLKDGHSQGILDFKFIEDNSHTTGWSLGGDGKLVQWNLPNATILR